MLSNPLDLRILQQEDIPFQKKEKNVTRMPTKHGRAKPLSSKAEAGSELCLTPALLMSPCRPLTSGVPF